MLRQCLLRVRSTQKRWWILLLLVLTGVSLLNDGDDAVTSLYITTQLVTTVGFGDIVPKHNSSRVITIVFIMFSLVVFAHFINDVLTSMLTRLQTRMHDKLISQTSVLAARYRIARNLSAHFDSFSSKPVSSSRRRVVRAAAWFAGCILFGTVFYTIIEPCSCSYGQTRVKGCDDSSYHKCLETGGKSKDLFLSFYMSVVTLTSVGLGDVCPVSLFGRMVSVPWMIVGVASSGMYVAAMTAYFFEQAQEAKIEAAFKVSDVLLDQLDMDGDGVVSKSEHHLYYLMSNGIIAQDILVQLDLHFAQLAGPHGNAVPVTVLREVAEARFAERRRPLTRNSLGFMSQDLSSRGIELESRAAPESHETPGDSEVVGEVGDAMDVRNSSLLISHNLEHSRHS